MEDIWAENGGIYFGYGANKPRGAPPTYDQANLLRYVGDRHIVTVGPNGSGKSRRLLWPNLRDLTKWSVVVVDPKGELAHWTKDHRERSGSRIIRLNPFDVLGLGSDGFNPVAALDPKNEEFADDAMGLAEAIIRVEGHEPHWSQSAQELICALIMYVRLVLDNPSLADVRALLGQDSTSMRELVLSRSFEYTRMTPSGDAAERYKYEKLTVPGMIAAAIIFKHPELEAKASRFGDIGPENRELSSVLSVALTQTRWLDSFPVAKDLHSGDFSFGRLKEEPTTVYLILPARRLGTHSTWLRLMTTSILQPLLKDTRESKVPILFMLDEFAQLGHLPVIEQTMALMRGYGIKLWAVFQDFAQAEAIYAKRWQTFLGNAGVVQAFAPRDVVTSESLSELAGQTTKAPLAATNVGPGAQLSRTQIAVPLMLPQDLRNMDKGFSILLTDKIKGVVCSYLPDPDDPEYIKALEGDLGE